MTTAKPLTASCRNILVDQLAALDFPSATWNKLERDLLATFHRYIQRSIGICRHSVVRRLHCGGQEVAAEGGRDPAPSLNKTGNSWCLPRATSIMEEHFHPNQQYSQSAAFSQTLQMHQTQKEQTQEQLVSTQTPNLLLSQFEHCPGRVSFITCVLFIYPFTYIAGCKTIYL